MTQKTTIYGGAGGIGSTIGRMLHARGVELHLVGRNKEGLAAIARELGATSTLGDVNDSSLFTRAAQDAGAVLGGLVYAVGTINLRSLGRLSEADFLTDFRVNAMGAALAIQAALQRAGAMIPLAFHGGTALRFLFAHGRYSETPLGLCTLSRPVVRVGVIRPTQRGAGSQA